MVWYFTSELYGGLGILLQNCMAVVLLFMLHKF